MATRWEQHKMSLNTESFLLTKESNLFLSHSHIFNLNFRNNKKENVILPTKSKL